VLAGAAASSSSGGGGGGAMDLYLLGLAFAGLLGSLRRSKRPVC
jgi:hypothetical protein